MKHQDSSNWQGEEQVLVAICVCICRFAQPAELLPVFVCVCLYVLTFDLHTSVAEQKKYRLCIITFYAERERVGYSFINVDE